MQPTAEANPWLIWALLSAAAAALTAIFAKIGLQGIDPDYATLIRTVVILGFLAGLITLAGKWRNPMTLTPRSLGFLVLSGLATGLSWVCYFRALTLGKASQVAPVDKSSVVLVALFAVLFLGERLLAREWLAIILIGIGIALLALRP